MTTYLDRILASHREVSCARSLDFDSLLDEARLCPPTRGFAGAIRSSPDVAVIAEIKRHSPSLGELAHTLDPADVARAYQGGGATCVSVLTDHEFFKGSEDDLRQARAAVSLPVLRKDFTVDRADVCDARLMGADAVLLIVAALQAAELDELLELAAMLDLDALVEVHDEAEAAVALDAGATMIGVNQRDLVSFAVDEQRAERVAKTLPDYIVRVAESGVRDTADVKRLADAGFDAVLVGAALVAAPDPAAAVGLLAHVARGR